MKPKSKHVGVHVVRESKYRQIIVEPHPASSYLDLAVSDASCLGEQLAASGLYLAYATSTGAEIGVIALKATGKRATADICTLKGHGSGPLCDLAFSGLDYGLLASGGSDGCALVWRLPADPYSGGAAALPKVVSPAATLGGLGRTVSQVRFHPSAANVLATAAASTVRVWDVQASQSQAEYDPSGSDVCSVSWSWSGALLAVASSDKSVRLVDPRQREVAAHVKDAHAGVKPVLVEWAGPEQAFFSTGTSLTRDRELCAWDVRSPAKALVRVRVDSNAGVLRPLFDPDTKLLYLSGHGDSGVRVYEAELDAEPFLHAVGNFAGGLAEGAKSAAVLPKPVLDVMGCEVGRVLRLSRTGVEAMRVEVPRRKAYRDFMEDLYPPTRAEGAAMSAPEYFAGRDAEPVLGPVRPLAAELSTSRETAERAGAEVQAEAEEEHEARRVRDAEDARLAERHEDLDKRFSKFLGYQAKLKFAKVTQATRDESCYNLAPDSSGGGADGVVLAASARLFVVPWKAAAGPVYVGDATRAGKHPSPVDATVVHGHRQAVTSVCANEFEDLVFATGSEDCQVRVWRFPEGGVASKEQAEAAVAGSGLMQGGHRLAVRGLGFHRVAAGLLCSFGADVSCKIWDVAAGTAALDLDPDRVLQNAAVSSADWSYQGSELVLAGRDSVVRIADPRAGTCVASFAAHDGVKSMRAVWLGAHPVVCSTGFGKTGDRQFRLWDVRNVAKPLSTTALDGGAASMQAHYVEDNGALVLWAKGELSVRIFELEGAAPDLPASRSLDVGRAKRAVDKFALHACTEFRASGEPSAVSPAGRPCALTPRVRVAAQALAFLPRRCVDPYKAEWLRAFRLTSSAVEALSFSVPRAQDLQSFFADDLFPPARSGVPGQDAQSWLKGGAGLPLLRDLNAKKLPLLSQRPVEQALEKVKRGVQNTDRFRKEQEEAEAKKRQQQEALDRMQRLAVQHEAYNPNLSKPGSGHDGAGHAVELGPKDVEDEEWGD